MLKPASITLFKNKHWSSLLLLLIGVAMYFNMFVHIKTFPLKAMVVFFGIFFIGLFFKLYHDSQEFLIKGIYNQKLISFWVYLVGYGLMMAFFIIQWMLVLANYLRFLTMAPSIAKMFLPQLAISSFAIVLLIFLFIQAIRKKMIILFNTAIICFSWLSAYFIASLNIVNKIGWQPLLKLSFSVPILCSLIIIVCMETYSLVMLRRCKKEYKA